VALLDLQPLHPAHVSSIRSMSLGLGGKGR
jgi:hypothetical protein